MATVSETEAQTQGKNLTISLLTCGPGTDEAYQAYGHTAIRIQDDSAGTDLVFNYGVFDFATDGFYQKFIQGKLLYFLAIESFDNFVYNYIDQKRWVRAQVLNLNDAKKMDLFLALMKNAEPENSSYLYDFTHNNCSTKPRDLIKNVLGDGFEYAQLQTANTESFREMIDRHMVYDEWIDLGIDLILGSRLDKKANNSERMFLPAELMMVFDSTLYQQEPLVKKAEMIYAPEEKSTTSSTNPSVYLWALLGVLMLLQVFTSSKKSTTIPLSIYFSLTGLIGIVVLFMWLGTDHFMTKWNWNIIWASPMNLVGLLLILFGKLNVLLNYVKMYRWSLIILLLATPIFPQQFHAAVFPLMLIGLWCTGKAIPLNRPKF